MAKQRKKIALLIAGGTWTIDKDNEVLIVLKDQDIEPWLASMSELAMLAEIEPVFIASEENVLGPKIWEKLAKVIKDNYKKVDGFVVVTKAEQLLSTTIALNFLLQNLPTTIVTTGSQMSGLYVREKKELLNKLIKQNKGLGLRANLVNALQIAGEQLPAPAIMYGRSLIWGIKAYHSVEQDRHVFTSVDNDYWAKVDFGISMKSGLKYPNKRQNIFDKIKANVLATEDIEGLPWNWSKIDTKDYQAVVVKARSQELTKDKIDKLKKISIPVVLYSKQALLTNKEGITLSDCTWPTTIIKTMWAVANSKDKKEFEKKMKTNIIGEFN